MTTSGGEMPAGDRLGLELSLIRSMLAFVADSQRIFRTKLEREKTREKVGIGFYFLPMNIIHTD